MEVVRPDLVPDPDADREAMYATQHAVADAARFVDDLPVDPATVGLDGPTLSDAAGGASGRALVAGVDQAFLDDPERAVSAVVVTRGDAVVERHHAVTPLSIPYVPGLLAFREGGPALDALTTLDSDPDLLLVDGSGRIHFRQAGLATHLGTVLDCPTVGVAKRLLCGRPREATGGRPAGWRTPIEADEDVDAPNGTVIGYAYQSRQFDSGVVNPLYVSPGHRVGAATAVDLVERCVGRYKLPEPVRLADKHADGAKAEYG
ncbi:MAG: endonuclease V [Haloferacaceae archaeon]